MVNKLWYQRIDRNYNGSIAYDFSKYRNYIQKFVDLYCLYIFKIVEDITPDNLQTFIEVVLVQYQQYTIKTWHLYKLGECLESYFDEAYMDEFESLSCYYPNNDRRYLVCLVTDKLLFSSASAWHIFPEDVSFVLACLNCPEDEIINMPQKLDEYFNQFDLMERSNVECPRRWEAIKRERIEALEKGEPLPIRPMSIELDPCYKK